MTLAEAKSTKKMKIEGTIGRVDLTGLWFKICIFPGSSIRHHNGKTQILFNGPIEHGLYVLGETVKACEATQCHCRLVVNHYFE